MAQRLFLLDSMALAYRAYFAMISNPLKNSKGENTSAIYGFVNAVLKIIDDERPDFVAAVFDTREPTFRHKAYPAYKATRERMPEDMGDQLPMVKKLTEALAIHVIELPGFEADDIIGTLAKQAEKEDAEVFLVTGDKDFMQLISDRVKMYNPIKKGGIPEIIDTKGVHEKFGVNPSQVIDVLGLMGDTADNIPGIKGIGEKTASKLIQAHGSLEKLLDNLDQVKGKLQENIRTHKEDAILSKKLATIQTDVPLKVRWNDLKAVPYQTHEAVALFHELEFQSLVNRFQKNSPPPETRHEQGPATKMVTINDMKELKTLVETWKTSDFISIRVDTDPSIAMSAPVNGVAITHQTGTVSYVPLADPAFRNALKPVLESLSVKKGGEHLKADGLALRRIGLHLEGAEFDEIIAGHLLSSDTNPRPEALAKNYLGSDAGGLPESSEMETGVAADRALKLRAPLMKALKGDKLLPSFEEIEMPLLTVLTEMEYTGVWLNRDILDEMSKEFAAEIGRQEKIVCKEAGQDFNLNSPQQLGDILFEKMQIHKIAGIEKPRRTGKTKQYATDIRVLELYRTIPIVDAILTYRQYAKLKSTYIDGLPPLINPETNRIHSTFSQTVAATGRLSSSNPNFQNIPVRSDLGREIRKAFTPEKKGWVLLSADYSQIELRVMAHLSGDENLNAAFANDEDIHASTAARVFGLPINDVPRELRRKAKDINFGIIYGISPFGLASRIGMSQAEARDFIKSYFLKYPRIKQSIDSTLEKGRADGFVTTMGGRRRYLPDLKSRNYAVRQNAERAAINTPIQGTAAEIIKLAMIGIHGSMKKKQLNAKMILQVHDELVFESPKDEVTALEKLVKREMENAVKLTVPLKVDTGTGENWLETK